MQDALHRVLLKTKEQILHITSVLYLLLGSPNVLSLADVPPKQLISFPDILRQTFQSLVPQFLRHPVKSFGNAAGDIMVGGWNFGCGSSREHAPLCIKTAGIAVVISKSFARIFYRNSINIGLPIMECPEAVDAIEAGDTVRVDFDTGVITDETNGKVFHAEPFPPFIQNIISAGGLMKAIQK